MVDWIANGELLRMWAKILEEREGQTLDTVYVQTDVETVSQLWPGIGNKIGGMLKLLEDLGRKAWTTDGVDVLTMQNLDLNVGEKQGDLVSTERAIRKLASTL